VFTHYDPEIGVRPGTLAIPPDSPSPGIAVVQYDTDGVDRREVADSRELRNFRDADRVTWVDVQGLGNEALTRSIGFRIRRRRARILSPVEADASAQADAAIRRPDPP